MQYQQNNRMQPVRAAGPKLDTTGQPLQTRQYYSFTAKRTGQIQSYTGSLIGIKPDGVGFEYAFNIPNQGVKKFTSNSIVSATPIAAPIAAPDDNYYGGIKRSRGRRTMGRGRTISRRRGRGRGRGRTMGRGRGRQ